jgi:DNA-binding Lrp family transcriptional regulator
MARNPHIVRQPGFYVPPDRIDRELLRVLQKNARISNKRLAEMVGIAPSTCLERVRRLVESGVIRGFHADVDPALIGRPTEALIAVRLQVHAREQIDQFYDHVLAHPDVLSVAHITGADDYLIHVAVRDAVHLRSVILDDLTARSEVSHVETHLIFENIRKPFLEPLGRDD